MQSAPSINTLAEAALALLAGGAERHPGDGEQREWRLQRRLASGTALDVRCAGRDLPASVPTEIARPDRIAEERGWRAAYRLAIKAPPLVFDVAWTPGEPLRIMVFSRGDWEQELLSLVP